MACLLALESAMGPAAATDRLHLVVVHLLLAVRKLHGADDARQRLDPRGLRLAVLAEGHLVLVKVLHEADHLEELAAVAGGDARSKDDHRRDGERRRANVSAQARREQRPGAGRALWAGPQAQRFMARVGGRRGAAACGARSSQLRSAEAYRNWIRQMLSECK